MHLDLTSASLRLENERMYHIQESIGVMAKKNQANLYLWGLKGSCLREPTKHVIIQSMVKDLISEAWSHETITNSRSHIIGNELETAIMCINEAVNLSYKSLPCYWERAIIHFHSRHFLLALKDLDLALEIDPLSSKIQAFRQSVLSRLTPPNSSITKENSSFTCLNSPIENYCKRQNESIHKSICKPTGDINRDKINFERVSMDKQRSNVKLSNTIGQKLCNLYCRSARAQNCHPIPSALGGTIEVMMGLKRKKTCMEIRFTPL